MRDSERSTAAPCGNVVHFQLLGELALRRHTECRARQPKRGAASLLRVVIAVAQRMAGYAELRGAALALLDHVIVVAQAEEWALAQAGNSSAYLSVWLAAAAAHGQIANKLADQQIAPVPAAEVATHVETVIDETSVAEHDLPPRAARQLPTKVPRAHYAPPLKPDQQRQRHSEKWR